MIRGRLVCFHYVLPASFYFFNKRNLFAFVSADLLKNMEYKEYIIYTFINESLKFMGNKICKFFVHASFTRYERAWTEFPRMTTCIM